jgi:site-specific DNA-cytosine methylase
VPWKQASHTLSEQGLQTSLAVHLHPEEDRVFTTKESARIMTLPDDYKLTGTLNEKLARIGLMVAPICLKYLADEIYKQILEPYHAIHQSKD